MWSNIAKLIHKHLFEVYIYKLGFWPQRIYFPQIFQQTILKGGMFTEGSSWGSHAYSTKYLSICLTLDLKLYWVLESFKHLLKILLLITYIKKFATVCPDTNRTQTDIQDQLMYWKLPNPIICLFRKLPCLPIA